MIIFCTTFPTLYMSEIRSKCKGKKKIKNFESDNHFFKLMLEFHVLFGSLRASLVAQRLKHLPAMWETRV